MDLELNFEDIRRRIETEKDAYKQGSWAKFVGVPSNIVSNIHGKIQQKPSFPYIISVARATGKSVDYYLWGEDAQPGSEINSSSFTGNLPQVVLEHIEIIKKFKNPKEGKDANEGLVELQDSDKDLYDKAINSINTLRAAARALKDIPTGNYSAPSSGSNVTGSHRKKQKLPKGAKKNGTSG